MCSLAVTLTLRRTVPDYYDVIQDGEIIGPIPRRGQGGVPGA